MDRAVLVLSALLLNAAFAGPRQLYAPFKLTRFTHIPATLIRDAERKLNREHRSAKEREVRGLVLLCMAVGVSAAFGWVCGRIFTHNLGFAELLLLAGLLPVRPTWDRVRQIYKGLKSGDVARAKAGLEGSVWRHHIVLDEFGVARAGIEMLAVHFSEKILAPALGYILFGMPGFFISKTLYLLEETLTPPQAQPLLGEGFGRATRTVHFIVNYIPARMAALFWALAAIFLPSGNPAQVAKRMMIGDMAAGSPENVEVLSVASALGLTLGGPSSAYAGGKWIGGGIAKANFTHVWRALYLFALLHLFLFILLGLFF